MGRISANFCKQRMPSNASLQAKTPAKNAEFPTFVSADSLLTVSRVMKLSHNSQYLRDFSEDSGGFFRQEGKTVLKTLVNIGNCQRPLFSLGVSQHKHKITNMWKFELNWLSKLRDNNKRKNTLVTQGCVLSDALCLFKHREWVAKAFWPWL